MYSRLFCYENTQQRSLRRVAAVLPVFRYDPSCENGGQESPRLRSNESPSGAFKRQSGLRKQMEGLRPDKLRRLSCPPKIQNILPLNMARAHAAAILDGLACPVHKTCKSSVLQQPSPVQRAFTFCTAAATRLPMGWSGTPTI